MGLAQWLMPVIPVLWEVKTSRSPVFKSSLLKIQKLAGMVAQAYSPILATREAEAGESIQPGWQRLQ